MDQQMLPSPGFSIPSIGTPLHQPEEDQQIIPHAFAQSMPHMTPIGAGNYSMPNPMQRHTYAPSFTAPTPQRQQEMLPQSQPQPQTPVSRIIGYTDKFKK